MVKKAKLKISARLLKKKTRRSAFSGAKACRFCGGKDTERLIDYKNAPLLKQFLTERGKILPSRISGACCFHQRKLAEAIKKSRTMALIPYCSAAY
jgi:small subunit ribosomal protein S18